MLFEYPGIFALLEDLPRDSSKHTEIALIAMAVVDVWLFYGHLILKLSLSLLLFQLLLSLNLFFILVEEVLNKCPEHVFLLTE